MQQGRNNNAAREEYAHCCIVALLQYQKKYGWVQKSCMFLWIEAEDK